jgi:hypothetical protein
VTSPLLRRMEIKKARRWTGSERPYRLLIKRAVSHFCENRRH